MRFYKLIDLCHWTILWLFCMKCHGVLFPAREVQSSQAASPFPEVACSDEVWKGSPPLWDTKRMCEEEKSCLHEVQDLCQEYGYEQEMQVFISK